MKKKKLLPAAILLLLATLLLIKDNVFFRELAEGVTAKAEGVSSLFQKKSEEPEAKKPQEKNSKENDEKDTSKEQELTYRTIKNAYIFLSSQDSLRVYAGQKEQTLSLSGRLSEPIRDCIADITLCNGEVTGLKVKKETLTAKVLKAGPEMIELKGYGELPVAKGFTLYRMYEGFQQETTEKLLVGLKNVEFVMEDGKICAALLREKPKLTSIRVLLCSDNFKQKYQSKVAITSDTAFQMRTGEATQSFPAGTVVTLTETDFKNDSSRRYIEPVEAGGRLKVTSLQRKYGNPVYRGTLEVSSREEGLVLINELSIEEYLYAVLPSEMPESFHTEARKAQAVCARSYAYAELLANRYAAYGANVDDSVSCQVYNNLSETASSIQAVKSTHGQILLFDGKVAECYYFSTSCGHTASASDVFLHAAEREYLNGRPHFLNEKEVFQNVPDNRLFAEFLTDTGKEAYDSASPWYRWKTFLSIKSLESKILSVLKERYLVVETQILTYDAKEKSFQSKPIGELGALQSIQIFARGTGGVVTNLFIVGSKNTFLIKNEYNVRSVLSPEGAVIERQNADSVTGSSLLPSAFISMQRGTYHGEDGYLITGGGYGHGVGMSQYGANGMAYQGFTCEKILTEYYPGTEIAVMEEEQT